MSLCRFQLFPKEANRVNCSFVADTWPAMAGLHLRDGGRRCLTRRAPQGVRLRFWVKDCGAE